MEETDVNKGANNSNMNILIFRKANGFTAKPFDTGSQGQMISLIFLRILFS